MASEHPAMVREDPERRRFEATVDGLVVGTAHYRLRDGRLVFTHTEVDDAFEGRGVGSSLARDALESARARGQRVVPLCPFVAEYIRRHDQYADLVDTDMLATLTGG